MKLSAIKKSVADGAGVTGQTLIYDSAVSTGSNTYLPTGLYGDSVEGTYAFTTNRDNYIFIQVKDGLKYLQSTLIHHLLQD